MSTEDSGQSISPTSDELTLDNTRLRQQLADIEEKVDERVAAAVAEVTSSFRSEATEQQRRQHRAELDVAAAQIAALTHNLQQQRRDADLAARERLRSRFSGLHTPMPARGIRQSSPTELNFDAQPATVSAASTPEKIRYKQPPTFSAIRKKDQMTFDNWQYAFLAYCIAMDLDTQTNAAKCIKLAVTLFAPEVARWYFTEYARIIKPSPITWESSFNASWTSTNRFRSASLRARRSSRSDRPAQSKNTTPHSMR